MGLVKRICLVCEKPYTGKGQLCTMCKRKSMWNGKRLSIGTVLTVKKWYNGQDPFQVIARNPRILYRVWSGTTHWERDEARRNEKERYHLPEYLSQRYLKGGEIPQYIKDVVANGGYRVKGEQVDGITVLFDLGKAVKLG